VILCPQVGLCAPQKPAHLLIIEHAIEVAVIDMKLTHQSHPTGIAAIAPLLDGPLRTSAEAMAQGPAQPGLTRPNPAPEPLVTGGDTADAISCHQGQWFAVQTKANAFNVARRHLTRQGFLNFAPTSEATRRQRGGFRTLQAPLFPGYIFVASDDQAQRWRAINSTYGVSRIVSFSGIPAPLPKGFIAALRARCDADGRILPEPEPPAFTLGEDVRITVGPFANLIGEILKVSCDRRVVLLLDLLGGKIRVTVSNDHLTRLS
jgi:transcriptional antiterminator RfaH